MIKVLNLIDYLDGSISTSSLLTDVAYESAQALKQIEKSMFVGDPKFDVLDVKQGHLKWLSKLEQVIRGRESLKPEEVTSGHECSFGHWYYDQGSKLFSNDPDFKAIEQTHLEIHEIAKKVVKLASEKNKEAIEVMLTFTVLRKQLFDLLDKFFLEYK